MSHFAVAVISDGTKKVSELLAPYQENNMGDCPKEYLEFYSVEDEYRPQYENDGCKYVFMPDGRRLLPWDDEFRVDGSPLGFGSGTHKVPEHLEQREIPYKETFATFDDYMREWCGYEKDPEKGKYGYWDNPNKKWDWWVVGGRFRRGVRATNGECAPYPAGSFLDPKWEDATDYPPEHFDQAKLGDMIWDRDEEAAKRADDQWRSWFEGEEIEGVEKAHPLASFHAKQYGDRETYVLCESTMWWRAVITPDGKWHEVGEMGWFGCSSESGEELVEWAKKFKERFIDPYPPEYELTVVDCHI